MGMFTVHPREFFDEVLAPLAPKDHTATISYWGDDGIQINLRSKSKFIGHTVLSSVSGPVVASLELYIAEKFRRKGYSDLLERMKIKICQKLGVELVIATVAKDNTAEIKAITKHGWTRMASLGKVDLWGKILKEPGVYMTFLERA